MKYQITTSSQTFRFLTLASAIFTIIIMINFKPSYLESDLSPVFTRCSKSVFDNMRCALTLNKSRVGSNIIQHVDSSNKTRYATSKQHKNLKVILLWTTWKQSYNWFKSPTLGQSPLFTKQCEVKSLIASVAKVWTIERRWKSLHLLMVVTLIKGYVQPIMELMISGELKLKSQF